MGYYGGTNYRIWEEDKEEIAAEAINKKDKLQLDETEKCS